MSARGTTAVGEAAHARRPLTPTWNDLRLWRALDQAIRDLAACPAVADLRKLLTLADKAAEAVSPGWASRRDCEALVRRCRAIHRLGPHQKASESRDLAVISGRIMAACGVYEADARAAASVRRAGDEPLRFVRCPYQDE